MSMEVDFAEPYLEMSLEPSTPLQTPQYAPVSIAGRPFLGIDTSFEPYRRDAFRHRSIQSQRESISFDNIPGVGTVSTENLWRREAWDWHFGAGQPYQDRKDSVDARFSISKGINPWMQWQVELLNDTTQLHKLAGNGQVMAAGQYLLLLDPSSSPPAVSVYSAGSPTFAPTFSSSAGLVMMATDGFNIWIAAGDGIWTHTTEGLPSGTGWTQYVTSGPFDGLWYVGDRLMATDGPNVYNIIASGSPPSALWTHPNPNWHWSSMCAGSSQIYLTGYDSSGLSNSLVYRTTIEATGTALTIPVQALPMEGGEYCTSLYGYLNYVFVGSNLGIRMCRTIAAYDPTGNEGDLEAGPLIPGLFPPGPVNSPVQAFTANNRFVYFGWTNYDAESTGLGRCDLSTYIDTQAPAFASDLMVTGQAPVTSMDWNPVNQSPVFVVESMGVYTASAAPVTSGYVQSGYIGYDISDDKIALAGDIGTVQPQSGSVAMSLAADANNNVFVEVGSQGPSDSPNQSTFAINATRANLFSVKMTLNAANSVSPVLNRWTLKALPGITSGTTISVVLALWEVEDAAGGDYWYSPYDQKAFLENLRQTQTLFAYVEGPLTYPLCTVDEIDWLPEKARDANTAGGYQGNIICYIKAWSING